MPWPPEPDPETAIRVGWAVTLLGVVIFVVSALGELLGWWDLVGEVGMLVGTVLSVAVGVGTWFSSAGRQQLSAVGADVRSVGQEVSSVDQGPRYLGQEIRSVGDEVRWNGATLEVIKQAITGEDGMLDELDVIQTELDAQTGVLGEQLAVLGEIRDRI